MKEKIIHQIPFELRKNSNWLRNLIVTLDQYSSVNIHWEFDRYTDYGDVEGKWSIAIYHGRNIYSSSASDVLEALYDVTTQAEKGIDEEYERKKQKKAQAMAKLSLEEQQLLGLV